MNTYSEFNERIDTFEKIKELPATLRIQRFIQSSSKFMLAGSDFFSIVLTSWFTYSLFDILGKNLGSFGYIMFGTLLLVFGLTFYLAGLYRSRGVSQIEEIRQLTITTTIIFLSLIAFHALMGKSEYPASNLRIELVICYCIYTNSKDSYSTAWFKQRHLGRACRNNRKRRSKPKDNSLLR